MTGVATSPYATFGPSARDLIRDPLAAIRKQDAEIKALQAEDDLDEIPLKVVKAPKLNVNIRPAVVEGDITLSIEGASTLSYTLLDTDRTFLRSPMWAYSIDTNFGDYWFRLSEVEKDDDELTLTFVEREIAFLMNERKRVKATRGSVTRAEFIWMLIRAINRKYGLDIQLYCPELHKLQPIGRRERTEASSKRERDREPGFDHGAIIRIKGARASSEQRRNLELALIVGVQMGATKKLLVAGDMAITQESAALTSATNISQNGPQVGLFQQARSQGWPATRDVVTDSRAFWKRLIAEYRKNPNKSHAELIEAVQGSGQGRLYSQWREEAERNVEQFSGSGARSVSVEFDKPYEFKVKPGETWWQTILRLVGEVNWRAFMVKGTMYVISEEDLFLGKSQAKLVEHEDGVEYINFKFNRRRKANEATVSARMPYWWAAPGTVVTADEVGPADNRWLVSSVTRPIFDTLGSIGLKQPMQEKPEPAPETGSISAGLGGSYEGATGPARARIVQVAQASLSSKTGFHRYSQPGALTDDPTPASGRTDCSQWTRAVYLKAGLPDPGTNTSAQAARGRRVASPRPGDLVLDAPSGADHVELYVGDGKTIGHGSEPIDYWTVDGMRAAFGGVFFVTFDFLDR